MERMALTAEMWTEGRVAHVQMQMCFLLQGELGDVGKAYLEMVEGMEAMGLALRLATGGEGTSMTREVGATLQDLAQVEVEG